MTDSSRLFPSALLTRDASLEPSEPSAVVTGAGLVTSCVDSVGSAKTATAAESSVGSSELRESSVRGFVRPVPLRRTLARSEGCEIDLACCSVGHSATGVGGTVVACGFARSCSWLGALAGSSLSSFSKLSSGDPAISKLLDKGPKKLSLVAAVVKAVL